MIVSIIVAMGENHVIARNGVMPWHLPDEFRHFKATTTGHHVIMGRKTFDSLGKVLKGRKNIVITRRNDIIPDAVTVHSLQHALEYAEEHGEDEAFIIGGGQVYAQALPLSDRLYLTVVQHRFDGDVFFPDIDYNQWQVTREESHGVDDRHAYAYTIYVMERKHLA